MCNVCNRWHSLEPLWIDYCICMFAWQTRPEYTICRSNTTLYKTTLQLISSIKHIHNLMTIYSDTSMRGILIFYLRQLTYICQQLSPTQVPTFAPCCVRNSTLFIVETNMYCRKLLLLPFERTYLIWWLHLKAYDNAYMLLMISYVFSLIFMQITLT